ncbi:MAG TPA: cob(I)yrinic acid a,c-diamide adenosyltransferase [Candidatus Levybacteria bacterium]|nr:cob(I)yrinic acid a,c-diamide adenosyltransferase [Candidatus Levybacteria bacterium]
MPIYTKTGDRGKTSLRSGSRVWKDSLRVETYGTIDELDSYIGVIVAELGEAKTGWRKQLKHILLTVQNDLLYVGSVLSQSELVLDQLADHITQFEHDIDTMTKKMPELSNFILPGGSKSGAQLQYARTLARRAERRVVTLARKEEVDQTLIKYVNRLSDLFFTMGRFATFKEKQKEIIWKPFK